MQLWIKSPAKKVSFKAGGIFPGFCGDSKAGNHAAIVGLGEQILPVRMPEGFCPFPDFVAQQKGRFPFFCGFCCCPAPNFVGIAFALQKIAQPTHSKPLGEPCLKAQEPPNLRILRHFSPSTTNEQGGSREGLFFS
ncbi:MAG: hypothetical protein QMD09_12275, partial [Desulfatibacillaceae bacterium]|nr:hypothetical protein [Desulfatibacillaceae bacterium]